MAFDKSVPYAAIYPVLPDTLDDDDDDLVREVRMLSMITAQEDEERRRLNRECNLVGRTSDPNLRSSLTLQESSSLPELVGNVGIESSSRAVEGSAAKTAVYSQIARPRPHSGRPVQGVETGVSARAGTSAGAPSGVVVPPPLPAVRPNARSRTQMGAVRIPSPPRTVQRNWKETPPRPRDTSANRSQSLSPPFHKAQYSIQVDLPTQGTVSSSFHDAPLICLSPPLSTYEQVDFDFDPLQPFSSGPPPALYNTSVTKAGSGPVPQNLPRPAADPKVLPYRNSPVSYPLDGSHLPPSPSVGRNDAVGGYPMVFGFMPSVANDLCSPSSLGFPISWITDPSGTTTASSASAAEIAGRNIHPAGSNSGSSSDLMDFSLDPMYMDLADFDPLYTVDSKAWNCEQRFDSDELFRQPSNVLHHSAVISATQPAKLKRPIAERPLAPLPDVVAQSSVARFTSVDELQDPFSVQDLMVSLERKRQQHAREQEAQNLKTVSSQRAPVTDSIPATNASVSKRKVLLLVSPSYF